MAAALRYGNVVCPHCKGTGFGSWYTAHGVCFRCGPNHTKELPRKWFGLTLEWEGRIFKAVLRSYDEAAAREDASDLSLAYLEPEQLSRDERGRALFDDPARSILCRWARGTNVVRIVPIASAVANKFVCANPGGFPVREINRKEIA